VWPNKDTIFQLKKDAIFCSLFSPGHRARQNCVSIK
jgi:hypothetical protein